MDIMTNKGLNVFYKKNKPNLFGNIFLPIIQRIYPRTLSTDLVAVQSIGQISGVIFYTDLYKKNKFRIMGLEPMSNRWIKKWDYLRIKD